MRSYSQFYNLSKDFFSQYGYKVNPLPRWAYDIWMVSLNSINKNKFCYKRLSKKNSNSYLFQTGRNLENQAHLDVQV